MKFNFSAGNPSVPGHSPCIPFDSKIKDMENCCNFTSCSLKDCYNSWKRQFCNPFMVSCMVNGLLSQRLGIVWKNTTPQFPFYVPMKTGEWIYSEITKLPFLRISISMTWFKIGK